jgi:uncharacterized membrane protein YciS (DUF1049 family)
VTVYEVLGILMAGFSCGFILGWAVCSTSYLRYRKTKDAMRVVDDFGRGLVKDLSETEFSKNRR